MLHRDQLMKMESAVRSALQGRGGTIVGVVEEMKTVQKPVGKLCTKLYTITGVGVCMVFLCSIQKKSQLNILKNNLTKYQPQTLSECFESSWENQIPRTEEGQTRPKYTFIK